MMRRRTYDDRSARQRPVSSRLPSRLRFEEVRHGSPILVLDASGRFHGHAVGYHRDSGFCEHHLGRLAETITTIAVLALAGLGRRGHQAPDRQPGAARGFRAGGANAAKPPRPFRSANTAGPPPPGTYGPATPLRQRAGRVRVLP